MVTTGATGQCFVRSACTARTTGAVCGAAVAFVALSRLSALGMWWRACCNACKMCWFCCWVWCLSGPSVWWCWAGSAPASVGQEEYGCWPIAVGGSLWLPPGRGMRALLLQVVVPAGGWQHCCSNPPWRCCTGFALLVCNWRAIAVGPLLLVARPGCRLDGRTRP